MELSKKEKLLAFGAGLYLLGLELNSCRAELEQLLEQGASLVSPEVRKKNEAFNQMSLQFTQMDEEYLKLKEELLSSDL